ncbi:MAG: phage tail tape measure protein, partial [Planctomycetota bacterium]
MLTLTSPSNAAKRKLDELGVSVNDAAGNVRPLADIIADLSASMQGLGSGERLEVLGTIFQARQAAGVAELLSQGAPKLREYTAALKESGGTAARIAGVQLNTLQGTAVILKSALEGLAIAVGDALAGPLRVVIDAVTKVVSAFTQWVRENRDLVVMLGAAAAAVGVIGAVLVTLGVAAQAASFVFGGLATILGAILSPISLVIAAVASLGTAIAAYSGVAGEALDWLKDQFGRLRKFVGKVTDGIADALAAGDIALAGKILWLSLKLVWQQGVAALNRIWLEAKRFFIGTAQKMWFGALAAAQQVWHALEVAWIETTSFLSKTWTNFISDLKQAWGLIQNWLRKRWIDLFNLFGQLTDEQARLAKQMADQDFADSAREIERKRKGALE